MISAHIAEKDDSFWVATSTILLLALFTGEEIWDAFSVMRSNVGIDYPISARQAINIAPHVVVNNVL